MVGKKAILASVSGAIITCLVGGYLWLESPRSSPAPNQLQTQPAIQSNPDIIPETPRPAQEETNADYLKSVLKDYYTSTSAGSIDSLVSEIRSNNLIANPDLANLINPNIDHSHTMNIYFKLNRNQDNLHPEFNSPDSNLYDRYSPDGNVILHIDFDEDGKDWNYYMISLPRDLMIVDTKKRLNFMDWVKDYSRQDYYEDLTRITGLPIDMEVYIGKSRFFVDLIDKILGPIPITFENDIYDRDGTLIHKAGTEHAYTGEELVYANVSRMSTFTWNREGNQMITLKALMETSKTVFQQDPGKITQLLDILNAYQEAGYFAVRRTDTATPFQGGYASSQDHPAMTQTEYLQVGLALSSGAFNKTPSLEGELNLGEVADRENCYWVDKDGHLESSYTICAKGKNKLNDFQLDEAYMIEYYRFTRDPVEALLK